MVRPPCCENAYNLWMQSPPLRPLFSKAHTRMGNAKALQFRRTLPPAALIILGVGGLTYANGEYSRRSQFLGQGAYYSSATNRPATSEDPEKSDPDELGRNETTCTTRKSDELGPIWAKILSKLEEVKGSVSPPEWYEIGSIKDYIIPDWTRLLPVRAQKLQRELSMAPGSLADEIWKESRDVDANPEILWEATVRVGDTLCDEELKFRHKRQRRTVKALASYLNIKEKEIHPDDVPIIAMCGSGGGLRALVAGTGSYLAAREAGLWDCVTYTAGVSGSCWLQALYHSSFTDHNFDKLINHLKNRLGVHLAFPPKALSLLTNAPTNKYLLRGLVEKLKGDPLAEFGLVDIYGVLLAARLLVPRGELWVSDDDLKLSNQKHNLDTGQHPLPIYTAVRHEIPVVKRQDHHDSQLRPMTENLLRESRSEAWFQWFEFTPYEFFCEELNAGIPTWALGRHFNEGRSTVSPGQLPLPELRLPTLMGIWGSAFCATLSHYYKEIRPLLKGIAGFSGIDSLIEGRTKDLIRVHPIDPAAIPNYVMGMKDILPPSCPESIFKNDHLRLMDSGMSNNLPIYPLLRPGRGVDIIVTFDASADIKRENWLSVVDGYARQRGIKGWPIGAGWPRENTKTEETEQALRETQDISNKDLSEKIITAQKKSPHGQGRTLAMPKTTEANQEPLAAGERAAPQDADLTYCNVWVGTKQERISGDEPPPSKRLFHPQHVDHSKSDFPLMRPDAGIAVVYFPLLPNPAAPDLPPTSSLSKHSTPSRQSESTSSANVSDPVRPLSPYPSSIDPDVDDFLSTWNFVYTPEQIDAVVGLAKANFAQGEEQVKRVVRAVYERKKRDRLRREMGIGQRSGRL